MKKTNKKPTDNQQLDTAAELRDIKALLVLILQKGGASQTEVAKALNTTQATVSRQFRLGNVRPFGT